ncbi:glycosyltransferase [Segetibacter koreensis]|uniref:glycosyltransferase n=1 Tax=Segetibacter koreensis TaxID=398037 RepID=UPI00037C700C|nr:glycosyltransferase [Segetibacter koreensis]
MRVLHIISEMDPKMGGVGQAVRTMVAGLTRLGIQNEIACLDAPDAPFLVDEKSIVYALGPGRGPWNYSKKLSYWLKANLTRFDTVIVHGLWLYNSYATYRVLLQLKAESKLNKQRRNFPKLFVMPHGMLDPYFQKAPGRKLKALRNQIFWKLAEHKLVNEADALLFTSLTEQQLAREPFSPYKPKRELVVGLGTEEPPCYTTAIQQAFIQQCPKIRNNPYILFLSRIDDKKGVDILIQAYKKALNKSGSIPKLVIAGPGLETAYGKQMQQMVLDASLTDHIFFTGIVNGYSKWGAFYGCVAFVLPSHQENFGIAVIEALACGKPVLITDQVNIWQEIKEAGAGLVAADSEDGVIGLIQMLLLMNENEKAQMGNQARALYQKHFAITPATKRLFEAITSAHIC